MRQDATEFALRAARRSGEARAAVISATSARELAECDERLEVAERRHMTELEEARAEMDALRDEMAGVFRVVYVLASWVGFDVAAAGLAPLIRHHLIFGHHLRGATGLAAAGLVPDQLQPL